MTPKQNSSNALAVALKVIRGETGPPDHQKKKKRKKINKERLDGQSFSREFGAQSKGKKVVVIVLLAITHTKGKEKPLTTSPPQHKHTR